MTIAYGIHGLLELKVPVRVYGTSRRALHRNIRYKPISNLGFIEDLARSRAVLATTGTQLSGEVLYFGKPMIGVPINCLEQRLNPAYIERMRFGIRRSRRRLTPEAIRSFLSNEDVHHAKLAVFERDGDGRRSEATPRELVPSADIR